MSWGRECNLGTVANYLNKHSELILSVLYFFDFYRRSFERSELGRIKKLLWECCERAYKAMCEASGRLGIRRPRTKYLDVEKANLGYAKCNNILVDGISFIEKLSFNAFNEGTRLQHCVKMHKRLFGVDVKKIGGDTGYAGTANRDFCKENGIQTSFVKRGRPSQTTKDKGFV